MQLTRLDPDLKEGVLELIEAYLSDKQYVSAAFEADCPFDYQLTDVLYGELSNEITRVLNGDFDVHEYFDMCVIDFVEEYIFTRDLDSLIDGAAEVNFMLLDQYTFTIKVKFKEGEVTSD